MKELVKAEENGADAKNKLVTGWEEVAAMADNGGESAGGWSDFDDFDEWAGDEGTNEAWLEELVDGAEENEEKELAYSPEVVFDALREAQGIARELLDEQSFEAMIKNGEFDEGNVDEALATISKVNAISYEDWQRKVTAVKEYRYGEPYAMILHSVRSNEIYDPKAIQHFYKYTSCSLATESNVELYHERYGFVYSAENIEAAGFDDMAADNRAENRDGLFSYRRVPILRPFREVLERTGEYSGTGFHSKYNEVIESGLPEAVFYYDDADYEKALMLKQASGLDIIKLYEKTEER